MRGTLSAAAVLLVGACAMGPTPRDEAMTPGRIDEGDLVVTARCESTWEEVSTGELLEDFFCGRLDPADNLEALPPAWAANRCRRLCDGGVCEGLATCIPDQLTVPAAIAASCVPVGKCGTSRDNRRWKCTIQLATGFYACRCRCS